MLPLIKKVKQTTEILPTKWQSVIFRNYGYVSTEKIAQVLGCDVATIEREAARLGLGDVVYDRVWEERGYITIIRNNWALLPYEQMITLLGITEEKLAFYLEKEDFLYVKLGDYKPACDEVRYAPLTDEEVQKTAFIADMVCPYQQKATAKPFDFFAFSSGNTATAAKRAGTRILHGYLTPCGDVFDVDCEKYMPDALLEEYQKKGVNGLWCHGLLSALSPYPFDECASEGYEARREELKKLVARCKKYGVKVYLYLNEPRGLAIDKFGKYAHLMGRKEDGVATLCLEKAETQQYLYEAAKDLLEDVRDLGGFITITMSENPTHCNYRPQTNCPICKGIAPEKSAAKVNNILMRAVRDSGTGAELIANLWGWSPFMDWTEVQTLDGVDLLDTDISVMCVSEYGLDIEKGGVKSGIIDYSISNPGPSEITKKTLSRAAQKGHKLYAKVQVNNSWECSAAPYLPAFDLTYEHLKNLSKIGVRDYMLTWTLGGYPSPVLDMTAEFAEKGAAFDLEKWYAKTYGAHAAAVHEAVRDFCEGFKEYPFSIDSLYFSPKSLGAANLWSLQSEEKTSTMVCFAYDDYETWIQPYPYETYVSQYEKLLKRWGQGCVELQKLPDEPLVKELKICAETAYLHFEADLLQTQFAYYKRDVEKYRKELLCVVEQAKAGTEKLLQLVRENACVGFEASNHYYYNERNLLEKLLNLRQLATELTGN
ncbi:MAG: hypothetical protein IKD47_03600 [Clostridia bacterium]|nr:hypothetical protein [Clostridia bacterium]